MTRNIDYKDTLFERANLAPICGKPTFETLQKLQKNSKSDYSNIGGWAQGHLSLVLTGAQHMIIYLTRFIYLTHPGHLIIMDGTTAHSKSNMRITHTEEVRLFCEVTGVEQDLVQQSVGKGQGSISSGYTQQDHKVN